MYVTELDSFVQKFHQLWKAGVTAHLDLDGLAFVSSLVMFLVLLISFLDTPGDQHINAAK